ncbi:MAG TPA: hypothetical protein VJN18_01355 [Polyangiaceae bacterium]|nr:hypothetical protein [Polyangiaceae bacterium]
MKTGRPPAWLIAPSGPHLVVQEVAELDGENRIVLPARLRDGLTWAVGDVLGVLEKPGRVRLQPWEASRAVLQRRKELVLQVADVSKPARDDLNLLRAIDDRFCRLAVRSDGRVRLHRSLRLHLQDDLRQVVAVRFPNELELWSPDYRNNRNAETADVFSDLV